MDLEEHWKIYYINIFAWEMMINWTGIVQKAFFYSQLIFTWPFGSGIMFLLLCLIYIYNTLNIMKNEDFKADSWFVLNICWIFFLHCILLSSLIEPFGGTFSNVPCPWISSIFSTLNGKITFGWAERKGKVMFIFAGPWFSTIIIVQF